MGVVGSVFAAVLTVRTVVMPPAVAALNIGVGPCWGVTCGYMLEAMVQDETPIKPKRKRIEAVHVTDPAARKLVRQMKNP